MKNWRIGILFAFVAILGAIAVSKPVWLSSNVFLRDFISFEIIAVLVVILTITFASVANIHLALNRIEAKAKGSRKSRIGEIRQEVNSDAWVIFWAFIVCVAALLIKGAFPQNVHIVAAANAVGLTVLLINALVLHTIYRAIFALVTVENLLGEESTSSSEKAQDYSNDSPPAGTP